MKKFTHLHLHSDHSLQDGVQSTDNIAKKAVELGMESIALTDHGRASGLLEFKKSCEKNKIKPIYGIEFYTAPESRSCKEKLNNFEKNAYHLTALAKNNNGIENIFRLSSIGWIEGFYYKPRIDLEVLSKYKDGLVIMSGCTFGMIAQHILNNRYEEAVKYALTLQNIFGDDFYLEVQNHGFEYQASLKEALFILSNELSIPIVATQDAHYTNREDAELQKYISKLGAWDIDIECNELYIKSYEEMSNMFYDKELHALDLSNEISNKCNCNWEYGKTIWPIFIPESNKTPEEELRVKALAGLNNKFDNPTTEYRERLEYELEVIERMGFATYFLIVADYIHWAKINDISVGPGRGSGCGSLVCYCIDITEIDPIEYGLFFERFLNPSRVSLPDLDIDFDPTGRKLVMQYVAEKYGKEKVAQIGTFAYFKPRGSLRAFARAKDYPVGVGEKLSALIPPDVAGKQLTFDEAIKAEPKLLESEYQDVVSLARKAEGLRNQAGVHAAGVVISNKPISDQIPLFLGKHDEIATQFDMHDVEEIGLVKYDFLGLRNLTAIKETLNLIKKLYGKDIDIVSIDKEDQFVYEQVFHKGNLAGVFQFENSSGFKDLCVQVKPRNILDLAAITSLYRPGPLGSGMLQQYIDGRNGKEIEYFIPELESILKDTYGVCCLQEQVMRICTDVAGYTLSEADNMRRIIGKKIKEKMAEEEKKFVSGCINNKIDHSKAKELFELIQGFSLYGFNAAHAVAYSVISYRTAWLKAYYKHEFYTSLLNLSLDKQDALVKYTYAAMDDDISIELPNINYSEGKFTLNNKTIIFGLAGVKGIGEKASEEIIQKRPEQGFQNLEEVLLSKIDKGTLSALAKCGALSDISDMPREMLITNLDNLLNYYQNLDKWHERNIRIEERNKEIEEAILAGNKPPRKLPKNRVKPEFPELLKADLNINKLKLERETLGLYLTGHPLDKYPDLLYDLPYTLLEISEGKIHERRITIPAVILSITEKRTKNGQNMAALLIEDKTKRIETVIFNKQWESLKDKIKEDDVVIINANLRILESDQEDTPPIIKISVNNILKKSTEEQRMTPIEVNLKDGSTILFNLHQNICYSSWSKAKAIAVNLGRIS